MAVYMVERELPGITPEQLAQAQEAAISTSSQFTQEGKPVRYIRSTFLPDESRCFCLFEAPTRQLVRDVNEAAGLPVSRIVQALDLSPVLMLVLFAVSMLSAACGANPVAPERAIAPAAVANAVVGSTAAARPSDVCSNVDARVVATLSGGTATGTISGDINGPVSAVIQQVDPSGHDAAGALHLLMEHHYTNLSPLGRVDTSDHAVLAPVDPAGAVYRMNNQLTIVGGAGIYSEASGYLHTHGTVNLANGAIDLRLRGRVCVPAADDESDGGLDVTFGGEGIVPTGAGDNGPVPRHVRAEAVALQPDGTTVRAGVASGDFLEGDRRFVFMRRVCDCYDVGRWHH